MPNISEMEAGPLAKEKCVANWEFGVGEGVCRFFSFTIDEVLESVMSPIVGLQNGLLVENEGMRLPESVDRFARCARPRHPQR